MKRFGLLMMLLVTLFLQACGQSAKGEETAQSFSSFTQELSVDVGIEDEVVVEEQAVVEQVIAKETLKDEEIIEKTETTKPNDIVTNEATDEVVDEAISNEVSKQVTKQATTELVKKDVVKQELTENKVSQDSKLTEDSESITKEEDMIEPSDKEQTVSKKEIQSGVTPIGWSEFFDGEDQTTPSDRFWDLKGSTVTIKGFMGEVLSFDKHWFLLIPEPGAECPFDNGDETYWNKIMIVFVPDDVKLRYHSGPIKITGRLDTGIKIDESSYKTMFRIYDATFEEIKE
ncbi:hypothetical protein [Paenibacillus crassostreae]|uniref:hypothetical protein n=1 Tax=Paenibacillus crassostreae TaxID=1763538 RepID=UPI000B0C44D2|nr:hypothetical protein [Paenibacillus crassostreae]